MIGELVEVEKEPLRADAVMHVAVEEAHVGEEVHLFLIHVLAFVIVHAPAAVAPLLGALKEGLGPPGRAVRSLACA